MKNSIYKVTLFISCVLLLPLKSQESEKTNLFGKWFEFKNRPIIKPKIINSDIISVMIKVESAGNDSAYNLKEDAVGCFAAGTRSRALQRRDRLRCRWLLERRR